MLRHCALALCLALAARGQEPAATPTTDAHKHGGESCAFEFVVKSAKKVESKKLGTYFALHSSVVLRNPGTLGVMVPVAVAAQSATGGQDYGKYHSGKQVRVTGKVQLTKTGLPEVWVSDARQIAVTNASPPPDPHDTAPPSSPLSDDHDPTPPSYLMWYLLGGGAVLLGVSLAARHFLKKPDDE